MATTVSVTALDHHIAAYLERQRALGRGYRAEENVLASLRNCVASGGQHDLDLATFERWCTTHASLCGNVRRNKQRIVRNFCLYRQRSEPACFVPDPNRFPRPHPHQAPVIVAPQDIARMLAAARQVRPTPDSPLRPHVLRLATVLLYSAGLRRGELLGLRLADANSEAGVLRIRESKFHKSRWVPLSADATAELREYLHRRVQPQRCSASTDPLLCHGIRHSHGYSGTGLSCGLHELIEAAQVRGWDGRRPRVHDLRHSFAVQCLLRWYRQGTDVQSQLPKLAMYMGHVSIASTAYYLRWVPELAQAASDRFEARFGQLLLSAGAAS
jgi:integrase